MMKKVPSTDVTTTREVAGRNEHVEFIRHTSDGSWECEGDTDLTEDNAVTVSMAQLIDADVSLREVASVPAGWAATRFDDLPWTLLPPDGFRPESVPPSGWLVRTDSGAGENHYACGEHEIAGAVCPNCDKPMLRMLLLDTSDERLGLSRLDVPFVHLLFCWTCELAQSRLVYRLLPSGGVELLRYGTGGVESDFPYENYPPFFQGADVCLQPVPVSEARTIAALSDGSLSMTKLPAKQRHLSRPRDQVGGNPLFLQGSPAVVCPECSEPMSFLACCADETPDGRGYTGNDFVQVVFMLCERDRVVSCFQECD